MKKVLFISLFILHCNNVKQPTTTIQAPVQVIPVVTTAVPELIIEEEPFVPPIKTWLLPEDIDQSVDASTNQCDCLDGDPLCGCIENYKKVK